MGFSSLKRSSGITHVWMSSMGIKKPLEGAWGMNKGGLGKIVRTPILMNLKTTTYGSCLKWFLGIDLWAVVCVETGVGGMYSAESASFWIFAFFFARSSSKRR
jgi:hypothetical protein